VDLTFVGSGPLSYNLVATHHLPWAEAEVEPDGPLSVEVEYDRTSLYVNESVTATVAIRNNTPSLQNMVLTTVGIPPGFQVTVDDLAEYVEDGVLSSFEQTGKQLTLYLQQLEASALQQLQYRLVATMPVKAADGGAQIYPYYEPKRRATAAATLLEVLGL
jgi:hypothetical protein